MTLNLVTGADGFVGQHLVAELLQQGQKVVGAVPRCPPELTTLSEENARRVDWVTLDLESRDTIREVVRGYRTDRVFHLAGLTSVARSLQDPVSTFSVNAAGTLLLLKELADVPRGTARGPIIVIAGSADAYGTAANRCRPLTEECPLEPLSPYAVSKATQEMLGLQFHRAYGLSVIVTRSFNHTGPGQRPPFVVPQFAMQILAAGSADTEGAVRVGNLDVRRDFTDVRDVVRAYTLLADRGQAGRVYNVCSGRSRRMGELLELLLDIAQIPLEVEPDPQLMRPADIPELVGDASRLATATGWAPQIELRQTLADLLDSLKVDKGD
ncbi:MAG: GDP-mannose 4,6-dehydratase [Gemmatimonadota bacterium]